MALSNIVGGKHISTQGGSAVLCLVVRGWTSDVSGGKGKVHADGFMGCTWTSPPYYQWSHTGTTYIDGTNKGTLSNEPNSSGDWSSGNSFTYSGRACKIACRVCNEYSTEFNYGYGATKSVTVKVTYTVSGSASYLPTKGTHEASGTVTLPSQTATAPSSVTVNSVSTGVGTATVSASVTGTYTNIEYSKDGSNWQTSSSFSGLAHNTSYTFYARAKNSNSAWTTSAGKSATTSGNAPTITAASASPSRTGATFSATVTYDTNASYSSMSYSTSSGGTYTSGTSVSGLTPNTSYTYYIKVTDNKGKTSAAKSVSFKTTGNAPSISSVSHNIFRDSAELTPTVTYDTNASFSSVSIQYGTSTSYGSTSTSYTLSNLSPNKTYYYSMKVTDNQGRTSSAKTGNFKTTAYLPSGLGITISNVLPFTASATVTGSGDTNAGITNYKYYYTPKPNVNTYDMPIKSFDGARWARIFYHNNKKGTVLFTSLAECKNTQTADKYSRLGLLDSGDTYKINGKYEFLLQYPIDDPSHYNRWKQTNAPQNEFITRTSSGGQVTGYEAVHIDWTSNYWGGLERNNTSTTSYSPTWLDGSAGHGNWFYAIGSASTHGRGIPSYNSTADVVELWIRIPDAAVTEGNMGTSTTANVTGLAEETTYLFNMSATNAAGTNYSSTVEVTTPADQAKIRIKDGGTWKKGKTWYKRNGEWVKAKKIYIKVNGQWVIGYNYEN
jgi:hypothetical protein